MRLNNIRHRYLRIFSALLVAGLFLPYSFAFAASGSQPSWQNPGTVIIRAGDYLSMKVSASGGNLTYSAVSLPSGAVFDVDSRKLTWTPTNAQLGYNGVVLRANNNTTVGTDLNFYIQVLPASNNGGINQSPYFLQNKTSYSIDTNEELRFSIHAADPDGDTLNYSVISLPAGASFNSYTRSFYWKPTSNQTGVQYAIFEVSDGVYTSDQLLVSIKVSLNKLDPAYAYDQKYTTTKNNQTYTTTNNNQTYTTTQKSNNYNYVVRSNGSKMISSDDYFARERAKHSKRKDVVVGVSSKSVSTQTQNTSNSTDRSNQANASSAFGALFSGNRNQGVNSDEALEIFSIKVVNVALDSNMENNKFANCDVEVRWQTNQPSVGQVLFGPISQAEKAIDKLNYPNAVMTNMEFSRVHGVRMGCLVNSAHYFKIFAYSNSGEFTRSAEVMLVPFGGMVVVNSGNENLSNSDSSASVLGTLGRFAIPVMFLVVMAVIGYLVVKWARGKNNGSGGNGNEAEDGEVVLDEPTINIVSGQS